MADQTSNPTPPEGDVQTDEADNEIKTSSLDLPQEGLEEDTKHSEHITGAEGEEELKASGKSPKLLETEVATPKEGNLVEGLESSEAKLQSPQCDLTKDEQDKVDAETPRPVIADLPVVGGQSPQVVDDQATTEKERTISGEPNTRMIGEPTEGDETAIPVGTKPSNLSGQEQATQVEETTNPDESNPTKLDGQEQAIHGNERASPVEPNPTDQSGQEQATFEKERASSEEPNSTKPGGQEQATQDNETINPDETPVTNPVGGADPSIGGDDVPQLVDAQVSQGTEAKSPDEHTTTKPNEEDRSVAGDLAPEFVDDQATPGEGTSSIEAIEDEASDVILPEETNPSLNGEVIVKEEPQEPDHRHNGVPSHEDDTQLQGVSSDEDNLALDVLPSSDDIAVTTYTDQLKNTLKLQQFIQTLMVVARYFYIAVSALATDAPYLIKAQQLLFKTLQLCDKSSLMVQNFQSGANNILEKLKIAYLYCVDGFEDFGRTDIEATKKDVKLMAEAVQKTKTNLGDLKANIAELKRDIAVHLQELELQGAVNPSADSGGASNGRNKGSDICSDSRRIYESAPPPSTEELACFNSEASFDENDSINRFKDCKGDKELLDARDHRQKTDIEQTPCAPCEAVLPPNFTKLVLALTILAIVTVVLHIVDEYDPIWNDITLVYPAMFVATEAVLGLEFLVLGIFFALQPYTATKWLMLLIGFSIALVYLQILDSRFVWWSVANNTWISFVILVILIAMFVFCIKVLCTGQPPPEFPHNITSIAVTRRRSREGRNTSNKRPLSSGDVPKEESPEVRVEQMGLQQKYGRAKLSDVVLGEAALNLDVASGLLDELVPVVEGWLKECEDVLEPAMSAGISQTESMTPEQKKDYWNSVMFKTEVTNYYCRWRALQVYSENTRPKLKTTRQRIEQFYTDNPLPRAAVEQAWKMAAEETVPEIRHVVQQFDKE